MLDDRLRKNLRIAYGAKVKTRAGRQIQPWKLDIRDDFIKLLKAEAKQTLLEIGAGTGEDSLFFKSQGFAVKAIDLSPDNAAHCREQGLDAAVMDMCALALPPASSDAVYALNCLLHLPKSEFPLALQQVHAILTGGGLFSLGQYGGRESAGVWEEDSYDPPRFFSFFTDKGMHAAVSSLFAVEEFKVIDLGSEPSDLHFQSLVLRKAA